MYPGHITRLSESIVASTTSITQNADLMNITGSTAIATIIPKDVAGFSSICILVPKDGTIGLTTAGNISIAVTMAQNRATVLVYSKKYGAWAPGAIS